MKKNEIKKISIYLPTKNRVDMLNRAVNSILEQTYYNWELIIVDDGSTDNTNMYLQSINKKDKRIKILINSESKGACFSRNQAISLASGEYITGLDDDDYFHKDRLKLLLQDYNPKYSFISHCHIIKNNKIEKKALAYEKEFTLQELLNQNYIGNQIFTETKKIKSIGGFDLSMPAWQDYDLWVRLVKNFGICKKFKKFTYIMDIGHDENRITTSNKPSDAASIFINKYEYLSLNKMTQAKIIKKMIDNKRLSMSEVLKIINKNNYKWVLKNVFK